VGAYKHHIGQFAAVASRSASDGQYLFQLPIADEKAVRRRDSAKDHLGSAGITPLPVEILRRSYPLSTLFGTMLSSAKGFCGKSASVYHYWYQEAPPIPCP
jgi:hypothetical protein